MIYSDEEILSVADIKAGENIFLIKKKAVEAEILENRGFVDTVTIERKIPDTVVINIRESQLLAYVAHEGSYYIMNRKCELLSKSDAAGIAGHIEIRGVTPLAPRVGEQLALGEAEASKEDYLADTMEQLLEKELYSKVEWIDASNVSSFKFRYNGRFTVDLGKNEELPRKFDALEEILALREENDRGTIVLSNVGDYRFISEQ